MSEERKGAFNSDEIESLLRSAADGESPSGENAPLDPGRPEPFQFQPFDDEESRDSTSLESSALQDVELDLGIELGRTQLPIEDVLKLKEGSVVPLDKLAGDPVDILINGHLIARGEVLVLNDNFCVRVAEILTPSF